MCFRTSRRYRRMVYGTVVAMTIASALIGAALIPDATEQGYLPWVPWIALAIWIALLTSLIIDEAGRCRKNAARIAALKGAHRA